jgi:hypothetical protein
VRGLEARDLAGEKCCWRVEKAGLRMGGAAGLGSVVDVAVVVVVVEDEAGRDAVVVDVEVDGWRAWRGREVGGGRVKGWEDTVELWDGGRRMVEVVRVVAEDLVRLWPRAGAAVEVEEGRPEDVVGRELVGETPEEEVGRVAGGLLREVMGGREVVVEDAVVLPLAAGCRTEADRPRPKAPDNGRFRDVGAPLSSPLVTAVEGARVMRDAGGAPDEAPLRGSLLGDVVRPLLWLSVLDGVACFGASSPPGGFRRDRDRDKIDDMPAARSSAGLLRRAVHFKVVVVAARSRRPRDHASVT